MFHVFKSEIPQAQQTKGTTSALSYARNKPAPKKTDKKEEKAASTGPTPMEVVRNQSKFILMNAG